MGMQIPCDIYAEVSQEGDLRSPTKGTQGGDASAGGAKRMRDRGRASDEGSCPHDALDTAQACGVACGRVFEREKLDLGGAKH